jgi:acyl-coenzyme A synthetase/AMP-(fatty) acid ligase
VGVVQLSTRAELDQLALQHHVRQPLAGYKVPKEIFAIDDLGRGPNGKADYAAITRYAESQSA